MCAVVLSNTHNAYDTKKNFKSRKIKVAFIRKDSLPVAGGGAVVKRVSRATAAVSISY